MVSRIAVGRLTRRPGIKMLAFALALLPGMVQFAGATVVPPEFNWSQQSPATSPPDREQATMASIR